MTDPFIVGAETVAGTVALLSGLPEADRVAQRLAFRDQIASLRREARQVQASVRLADGFAKLGGGSLLTATVLLMVNGQAASPVILTACVALLLFTAATIFLVRFDRRIADLDFLVEVIEAALKETQ